MVQQIDSYRRQIFTIHRNLNFKVSAREEQILEKISEGLTTDQIAKVMFLSPHTVLTHRKALMHKMGAPNAASLVRKGFESGLLKL